MVFELHAQGPAAATADLALDCQKKFLPLWSGEMFGALGIVLFILHILFHIVEILLIPTILVWLGLN